MPSATRNDVLVRAGILGAVLLTLVVGGCADAGPTAPPPAAETFVVAAGLQLERPFQLRGDAVLLAQQLAPDFGPPLFGKSDFGGRCTVPSDFVVSFAIEGNATRMGRFTAIAEHCSVIDFASGGSAIHDGVMVITAANGDELWSNYERPTAGESTPEDHVFVGGTGRFTAASGGGLGHPDCDRSTGTCTFELEGEIVYDASHRAD